MTRQEQLPSAPGGRADRASDAADLASDAAVTTDLELLRAYEPVVRYTAGELFLPTAVEPYVAHAALWEFHRGGGSTCLVPGGELSLERLVDEACDRPDADLSLQFVARRLDRRAFNAWRKRPERPVFRSHGRFTQVGLLSRIIDALFRFALLLRGRVPGGVAAAAEQTYRQYLDPDHHPYYGRVVREGGYVVLQYWFFYAMNDWRSSFGGANDHEGDWEQVIVYLTPTDDTPRELVPAWVAFSAHDEVGDDLRRRWDDPDFVREGDHPVVFAGAGSHSGAFIAREYVTAVNPPAALRLVLSGFQMIAKVITPWSRGEIARGVGIPFVDYSRGDGEAIGPGQDRTWSPVVIDDATPWVHDYRGLWGLDTRDRFGGERAPAGPRCERGGAVRVSWADPLGWAGLQKVPVSDEESAALLRQRVDQIGALLPGLDADIVARRGELRQLVAEATSLGGRLGFAHLVADRRARIKALEVALQRLVAERVDLVAEREAHEDTLARPPVPLAAQAHIAHRSLPADRASEEHRAQFLRVWSTISTPLLFLAVAWLLIDHSLSVVAGTMLFAVGFLTVEALARGRLIAFAMSTVAVVIGVLATVAIVQGILGQWQIVLAALLGIGAGAVLVANLRDLRRG